MNGHRKKIAKSAKPDGNSNAAGKPEKPRDGKLRASAYTRYRAAAHDARSYDAQLGMLIEYCEASGFEIKIL